MTSYEVMILEIENIFSYTIIIIGTFLCYYFMKNQATKSNIWLGILNLIIVLHFSNLQLLEKSEISHYGMVFGYMYGPVIFNFVGSHFEKESNHLWIHFVPAFSLLIWIVLGEIFEIDTPGFELVVLQILLFIHIGVYLLLAYQSSKEFTNIGNQTRSHLNDDRIRLIQRIIFFIGILSIAAMIHSYFGYEKVVSIQDVLKLVMSLLILIGMFGIIYQGMDKSAMFKSITFEEKQIVKEISSYASSNLTEEQANQFLDHLLHYMNTEKPYKKENISIEQLAKMTGIQPRHLSQIINQKLNLNYFDFINSHRIRDVQEQLLSGDQMISEAMYNAGFTSRSSFNTAFKKYTGLTPTQYRKAYKN